jgi:hypothetical protein
MNENRRTLEAFLRTMEDYHRTIAYRGLPSLLLASGRWFEGRRSSEDYDSAKKWKSKHDPKEQKCYYNAQSFCLDHVEARYFEGYALFTGLNVPAEHAWAEMPDGNVVDFTFEAMEEAATCGGVSCDTRDTLYVGLEIPTAFVRDTMIVRDWFDDLAEDYVELLGRK